MDQRALVERAKEGEQDAFATLVSMALARLDAAARLILRDAELARDAIQEARIRAWRDLVVYTTIAGGRGLAIIDATTGDRLAEIPAPDQSYPDQVHYPSWQRVAAP